MDIDELTNKFIASMQWSPETSDEIKSLVIGNVRGFAIMVKTRMPDLYKEHEDKVDPSV